MPRHQVFVRLGLTGRLFAASYRGSTAYTALTAQTIARAIGTVATTDYMARIYIDGLTRTGAQAMKVALKQEQVHFDRLRGLKDEQEVFLRLADTVAGLLRDASEGQPYAQALVQEFRARGFLTVLQ